jgi:hypothetical protein
MTSIALTPSPQERRIWKRCFWAGIAALILGTLVLSIFPNIGGDFPPGYGTPVIAFEFASTADEAKAAVGNSVQAMRSGTYSDFFFIIAFGLFLISFFHAAKLQTGQHLYKFMAAVALIAALSDIAEDIFALQILNDLDEARGVAWMHYFAKAKFIGLGVTGLGAAVFLLRQHRILRKIEGAFTGLGGALTLIALTRPEQMGDMLGLGITIAWIAMLAYAATQSFKKVPPAVNV